MDCWSGAKILCDFWDTKINTDNIILTTRYRSEDIPGFVADPEEIKKYAHELVNNAHMAATDNKIRDTILINQKFDYLYAENGRLKAVVVDNNGEPQVTDVTPDKPYSQSLITDGQGDTLVVSKKGQVMGVKEYKFAGDDRHLLNEYHRQLDSLGEWQINFTPAKNQTYAFDQIGSGNHGIFATDEYYPKSGSYDFRYKSVECGKSDKVKVEFGAYPQADSVIFKDKYGVTYPISLKDNILTFTGVSQADTNFIYAYRGDQKIGKLFLNTYQQKTYKVVFVRVNKAAKKLDIDKVNEVLNKVYNQCAMKFEIATDTITIKDLHQFSHGGSGVLTVYNDDQKRVLQAYEKEKKMKDGVFYLFFIDNVTDKKDGNGTPVSGYMPRGYNAGFIYDGGSPHTIAHELGHGIGNLEHVFENSNNSGKTANLMDYANGEELWHFQWDQIQDPSRVWMKWNKDESEGENEVSIVEERNDWDKDNPVFYTPAGMPITIIDPKKTKFVVRNEPFFWTTPDGDIENDKLQDISKDNKMYMTLPVGTLMLFDIGDKAYTARFKGDEFIGYYCLDNNSYYVDTETQKKDWRLVNTINDWSQSWKNGKFDLVEDDTYVPNEDNYEYRGQSISHCYDEILNSYKKNGGSKIVLFNPNRRVVTIINTKELTINDLLGKEIGEEINWSYIKTAYDDLDFVEYTPAEFQENRIMNIPYENRVEILRAISKSRMNAYKEEIALKIVSSIEKDRCDDFIDALNTDGLMKDLCYHIDGDNYAQFVFSVYDVYCKSNKINLNLDEDIYLANGSHFYFWESNVKLDCKYTDNNQIEIIKETDRNFYLDQVPLFGIIYTVADMVYVTKSNIINPFDFVVVKLNSVPEVLEDKYNENDVMVLPAFVLHLFCNMNNNIHYIECISDVFTVISVATTFGTTSYVINYGGAAIKLGVTKLSKNLLTRFSTQHIKNNVIKTSENVLFNSLTKNYTAKLSKEQLVELIISDIEKQTQKTIIDGEIRKLIEKSCAEKIASEKLKNLTRELFKEKSIREISLRIWNEINTLYGALLVNDGFEEINADILKKLPVWSDELYPYISLVAFQNKIDYFSVINSIWNISGEIYSYTDDQKTKINKQFEEINKSIDELNTEIEKCTKQ